MTTAAGTGWDSALGGRRYVVVEQLGAGGAAIVHRVRETSTGREVALKRLRVEAGIDAKRSEELFRQEFYTLSQLAHPHVVSVHDYGVDDQGPYYTMELLSGGDLLERAPCDWRTACRLARDVCSALSLIHSRRMVYRDLSPRNVRCTSDGRAKLVDFGALTPMGRAKTFVGTPAISPPEAVHFQPLDARSDLYSVGATFYYALTRQRAYAASSLAQLPGSWRIPPPPPSDIVPGIPPALDALILELLQLDPSLRPASAAETMDRLTAIASLDREEQPRAVSRAYLSTPILVGRDASLGRFRRRIEKAIGGRGAALLIQGPRGVGRTRFLDACVLEAKLAGVTVLRADSMDSIGDDYGVARALSAELFDALPDVAHACAAPTLALLARLGTGSRASARASVPVAPDAAPTQADLQSALRELLVAVAGQRPLLVAIDDVHHIDPASAALVAMLGRAAPEHPLVVAATLPGDQEASGSNALQLLLDQSYRMRLAPLSAKRAERLLRSVFGDVPNVQLVARRLHAISKGLPRDLMQLAQHLVDEDLVHYRSGAWALPSVLDSSDLPGDMMQARGAKVGSLSDDALLIARALALGPDGRYTFDECVALTEHGDAGRVMPSLNELVQAEIVSWSANDYSLAGLDWREPLLASLDPSLARGPYLRLATVFQRRATDGLRAAQYLMAAGEEEQGLDALLRFAEASVRETTLSMEAFEKLLQSLPEDWLDVFDRGLELCEKYSRSREQAMNLHERVTGIASQLAFDATKYFAPLFEQLVKDTGLDLYATLDANLDPRARLQKSLALAGERYEACTDGEYVLEPAAAVRLLGRTVARGIGNVSTTLSIPLLELLPSLSPLSPLSPALRAWQTLVDGVAARMLAQRERARAIYVRQLERLAQPDRAGLDETYQVTQVLGITLGLGTLEAAMGLASSLERAKALESSPLHEVNAIRIRMLYHLWQCDPVEADRCKSQAELLSLERAHRQTNEGAHLLGELLANALSDDLTRVKRTLDAIQPLAARTMGWQPVLHWAQAEYERIRGDPTNALAEVEKSLRSMDPAGHPVWPDVAGARVRILLALDRWEEARTIAEGYVREAAERGLGYEQNYVRMPLAIALSRLGEGEEAVEHAQAVIASFESLGSTGLNLGLAHETRARVCIDLSDWTGFERYAALSARHYRTGASGPLAAKHERLRRAAERARRMTAGTSVVARAPADASDESLNVATILDSGEPNARAMRTLEVLLETSGATDGFLFTMEAGEPVLRVRLARHELPASVLESAIAYLTVECRADEQTVLTEHGTESQMKSEWTVGSQMYRSVVLSHCVDDRVVVTGLAVLVAEPGKPYRHPAAAAERLSRATSNRQ